MSTEDLDYLLQVASGMVEKRVYIHPEKCLSCLSFEDTGDTMDDDHRYWCNGVIIYNVGGFKDCVCSESFRSF